MFDAQKNERKTKQNYKSSLDILDNTLHPSEYWNEGTIKDHNGNDYDLMRLRVLLLALYLGKGYKKRINTTTVYFFKIPGSKRRGRTPRIRHDVLRQFA